MNKISIAFLIALVPVLCHAQKEIGFGYGYSPLVYEQTDGNATANYHTPYRGVYASFTTKIVEISQNVHLRSGVLLSYGRYSDTEELDKEAYLNIPFDFRAEGKIKNIGVYCAVGPRLSYGLMSSVSPTGNKNASVNVYKSADYKRFDLMFGSNFGIVIKDMYIIQMSFDNGLLTRYKDTSTGTKMTRLFYGIGAGIIF